MENHQNENEPEVAPKPTPADGKIDLSDYRQPENKRIFGPKRPYEPRPILPFSPHTKGEDVSSDENENAVNAMTEDFRMSLSGTLGYNDDLDMDQQSQEYWDNS